MKVTGFERRTRRWTTAVAVLAVGTLASLSAHPGAAFEEFLAFAFVAVCAFVFLSRVGALMLAVGMAAFSVWNNHDIAASASPTGRALGTAVLVILLFVVAVAGVIVDLAVRLLWLAAHRRPPLE
jgi:hypothetical protein